MLLRLRFIRRLHVKVKSHCASAICMASTNLLRFIEKMVQDSKLCFRQSVSTQVAAILVAKCPQLQSSWQIPSKISKRNANTAFELRKSNRQECHFLPELQFSQKPPSYQWRAGQVGEVARAPLPLRMKF